MEEDAESGLVGDFGMKVEEERPPWRLNMDVYEMKLLKGIAAAAAVAEKTDYSSQSGVQCFNAGRPSSECYFFNYN
ncbi:hypothetical protein LINGRAHAP2_LOCUS21682 [Linum grandiflorum]